MQVTYCQANAVTLQQKTMHHTGKSTQLSVCIRMCFCFKVVVHSTYRLPWPWLTPWTKPFSIIFHYRTEVSKCGLCLGLKGCGYCLSTLRCMDGDHEGPLDGSPCPSWIVDDAGCPGKHHTLLFTYCCCHLSNLLYDCMDFWLIYHLLSRPFYQQQQYRNVKNMSIVQPV